jgi:hypothetical protein
VLEHAQDRSGARDDLNAAATLVLSNNPDGTPRHAAHSSRGQCFAVNRFPIPVLIPISGTTGMDIDRSSNNPPR